MARRPAVITDMRVPEISVVAFACYEQTDVQVAQRALVAFETAAPGQQGTDWLPRQCRVQSIVG